MTERKADETKAVSNAEPQYALMLPDETIAQLDHFAKMGQDSVLATNFRKTLMASTAVAGMMQILTPQAMGSIMSLQNTGIGFLTDRKGAGYDLDTVRACVVEAVMKGVLPVGNQFNIIGGRCYVTKEGMKEKLRNVPGLHYVITCGIPKKQGESGAICSVNVEWTHNGVKNSKALEFAVRMNAGMGADALNGKATRKALAWLYENVSGQSISDGEVGEDAPMVDVTPDAKAGLFAKPSPGGVALEEM